MKSLLFLPKSVQGDLPALFALALLIRLLAALPQQQPNYMDAAYSYVNALNLVEGRGFIEDFVWIYLDNPDPPPHPSHLYWMPLTSILAWLGMIVGGPAYRAAQVPFIVISAFLAPITYGVTYTVSRQRWQCWLAGLLAVFSGFYFPFWTAIDNFTPFAVAGSLALLTAWRAMNNETMNNEQLSNSGLRTPLPLFHPPYLFIAGMFVGLAHLSRVDGPLLLIAIILTYLLYLISHASRTTHYVLRITFHVSRFTFYLILGYLLVMTPWFVRNWQAVGTPLPTAGSQTIWLTSYDELFSYGRELSAQTFFARGLGSVLQGRWWVLTTNLKTVLAVWGMIFLLPLALVGFWHLRYHLLIQLAGLYALFLFVTMTLIFAFPGARGGLFHSGTALLPSIYAAAVVGLNKSIDWIAAHRRHWDVRLAKQVFGVGMVALAVAVSGFIYYRQVIHNNAWNNADSLYPAVAQWVAQQNPSAVVMINNPPAYRYRGGGLSVVVPNEDIETTLQVAYRYQVDYLILDRNRPVPLAEIYNQTATHPRLSLVKTFGDIYIFEVIWP
jgi:hypothetical protein